MSDYPDQVSELLAECPSLATVLQRAHLNRLKSLIAWVEDEKLHALEELIQWLTDFSGRASSITLTEHIAPLFSRSVADFEMAIESGLSGMNSLVFDAMRDVMEIEYLLRDFAAAPSHISEWLRLPRDERGKKFSPNALRQRRAKALGVSVSDLPTSTDYRGHSIFLHVNPPMDNPLERRGILEGRSWLESQVVSWELFRHGSELAEAGIELLKAATSSDSKARSHWLSMSDPQRLSRFTSCATEVRQEETEFLQRYARRGVFWRLLQDAAESIDPITPDT